MRINSRFLIAVLKFFGMAMGVYALLLVAIITITYEALPGSIYFILETTAVVTGIVGIPLIFALRWEKKAFGG